MKKIFVLTAMFCLCFQAISVSAATPDFSGYWELDVSKSTLPDAMHIKSIVLMVSQTEKILRIQQTIKLNKGNGDDVNSDASISPPTVIYSFDDSGTITENGSEASRTNDERKVLVTSDGKLNLNSTRNVKNEAGIATKIKTNEIWELLDVGKTLKVTRYTEMPGGAMNAELYFTKRPEGIKTTTYTAKVPVRIDSETTGRKISGGVLNGKATTLVKPEYPPAARAVRASGAVNVQVTIDEQGNVISTSAVSGHPLLRSAAEAAARNSKFAPTMLEGIPVKITGIIVYNFVP